MARIRVRNTLTGTVMRTPTFPLPPNADGGLFLFPIEAVAVEVAGGATVSGSNEVLITAPAGGDMAANRDWDGEPCDYFGSSFRACDRLLQRAEGRSPSTILPPRRHQSVTGGPLQHGQRQGGACVTDSSRRR
jgi:hypothetical protein